MADRSLVKELLNLRTVKQVEAFIAKYGQTWKWEPIGDRENAGTIEMGSEPGDALAERITNGIDAILERKYFELGKPKNHPRSPKEAVSTWFGVPDGDLTKLNENERRKLAEKLTITLQESGNDPANDKKQWEQVKHSPTVTIQDRGIGQPPDRFKQTFLSIGEKNKVNFHFLIGAYGQGGSTVYAFSRYTVIISRRPPVTLEAGQADEVGWTIIRCNERNYEQFRKVIYEYCTSDEAIGQRQEDGFKINRFNPALLEEPLEGTIINLIQFELPNHYTVYTAPSSSLWWLTHQALFDTVYPFNIRDQRSVRFDSLSSADGAGGRIVCGNYFRLTSLSEKKSAKILYGPRFWELNLGEPGRIKVMYWIAEDKNTVQNYVERTYPAVITFNGQRQIPIAKADLHLKGRDFVKDRLIIQISGDQLSPKGQRIFSSTRDRARKNETYVDLLQQLQRSLASDEDLAKIDRELKEKTLAEETSEQEKKAKELLAELLQQDEQVQARISRILSKNIELPLAPRTRTKQEEPPEDDHQEAPETPQKPSPAKPVLQTDPTKVEILNTENPLPCEKGYGLPMRLFIDAVDNCFTRKDAPGVLSIAVDPTGGVLERGRTDLRNGRLTVRLEPGPDVRAGSKFTLTVTVSGPIKGPFSVTRQVEVTQPKRRWRLKGGTAKNKKPEPPRIIYVKKDHTAYTELGWSEKDVSEFKDDVVYINMENEYVKPMIEGARVNEGTRNLFATRYGAHMAFVTMLQKKHEENLSAETPLPEGYRQAELQRASRAIIRAVALDIDTLATD